MNHRSLKLTGNKALHCSLCRPRNARDRKNANRLARRSSKIELRNSRRQTQHPNPA